MSTNQAVQTEDLIETQLRLEEEMTQRGAERYARNVARAQEAGREDGTAYGKTLLSHRMHAVEQAIKEWKERTAAGHASHRGTAYKHIKDADNGLLAYLTLKYVLSGLCAPRTVQYVSVSIGTAVEDEIRFADIRIQERKEYDRLLKGAAKRTSASNKHIYATRHADAIGVAFERWTRIDRMHVGMKLLDLMIQTVGLVEVATNLDSSEKGIKYVKALPETLEWIEKKNEVTALLRPVFEPMVVQPRDWTTPTDGGYLSSSIKPLKLVKTKNRAYLEELRNVDMPVVYEAVNTLQRTPWQINSQVLEVMRTLWTTGSVIAGLPPRTGLPLPAKPHDIDTNEAAQKEYRVAAAKTHMENASLLGSRIAFSMTLDISGRYEQYRKVFFPHQLDFRGRIYAVPHLNPQGADHQKALLRLANGKPVGEEGWKWLAFHGANLAGYDKARLEDRVQWVLDNEEEILAIAANPYDNRGWCTEMGGQAIHKEKPWQFLAFCFEWAGYCEHGEAFVSKLPIALDGSCSGIQHFSAMLRDELGGAEVNLVPREEPADVYARVAEVVKARVMADAEGGTEDELRHREDGTAYVFQGSKAVANEWLKFGISRKTTKRSVMTLAYGSKEYGFKEQLMEDILWPAKKAATRPDGTTDEAAFPFQGDGYRAALYMAKEIWVAVNQVLVKAGEAMRWLQGAASLAAKEGLPVRWTTPVGFPVMQAYPEMKSRKVETAINGKVLRILMNQEQETLDKRRQSQGIAPNFVHAADASHAMLTVVRAKQEGITSFSMIHDSFGTTAGDTEAMFRIVREAFVEMYTEVDVLGEFRAELEAQLEEKNREKLQELPGQGSLDLAQVVSSRFCFA
jgi:DNA-directed RNA polymerase